MRIPSASCVTRRALSSSRPARLLAAWGTAVASTSAAPRATTPQQQAEAAAQGAAQTVAAAEAVTGGSSDAVSSVPDDSVVWDLVPDGQTKAFVFVQAPGDPNAPTVATDNCGG